MRAERRYSGDGWGRLGTVLNGAANTHTERDFDVNAIRIRSVTVPVRIRYHADVCIMRYRPCDEHK